MLITFYPLLLWLVKPRVKVQVKAFTSLSRLFYVCGRRKRVVKGTIEREISRITVGTPVKSTTAAAWSRRRLVDVYCEIFSSRLVCSALCPLCTRVRRKHADVPCLPLTSATGCAIIPRAARHASTRTRTFFVVVSAFLLPASCVQRWLPEG